VLQKVSLDKWQVFALQGIALVFALYGLIVAHVQDGVQTLCVAVVTAVVVSVTQTHASTVSALQAMLGTKTSVAVDDSKEATKDG
jgi:hypothetical protein